MSIEPEPAVALSLFGPSSPVPEIYSNSVPRIRRHTAIVALGEINGVGHATATRLYDSPHFDSLFTASLDEAHWIASSAGIDRPHAFAAALVRNQDEALLRAADTLARYEEQNITLIIDADPAYPSALRSIPDAPRWLFVRGNVALLDSPRLITVVGTRKPSAYGISLATRVTELLVRNGFAIVSGLAEGIDAVVHERVVKLGGQTLAVLGTGLDNQFPAATAHLRDPIVRRGGALVTEYFNKEQYSRQRFVQRNRIQAALSEITVPIEASVPSGTLHTVRFAKQYQRLVIGVKLAGIADTALHAFLREENFPVVDVPEHDDPFMEAVGSKYAYAGFVQMSERDRRASAVARIVRNARSSIKREGLGDLEIRQIANGIQGTDPGTVNG